MHPIGFIGLGSMGGEIAKAIAGKGYELTAFDSASEACEQLEPVAAIAESADDVFQRCEIIFLSLPSSLIVEPMVENFILSGVEGKTIVDTSTSDPLSTKRLYKKIRAEGGQYADLTISGMPGQAPAGKLMGMFGGDRDVYEQLAPIVACFADRYEYMGESGCGNVTKLIFNFIALSYVNLYAMAFSLSDKEGLDNHQILRILQTTGMHCGIMDFYVPKMIDKTYDMAFKLKLAYKDLALVKGMFDEYKVPAYALNGIMDYLRTSMRDGKGEMDYSASIATMFEFFEKAES